MASWQETYKKLKKQKEVIDALAGGGDLAPIKSSVSNRNIYTKGAESKLQSNISPTKTTSNKTTSTKKKDDEDKKWYQKIFSAGAFDDGYDFGDLTKTILGTTTDVVSSVAKAPVRIGEGIGDAINYGIAGVGDLLGKDEWADEYRKKVAESSTDKLFKGIDSFTNKNSVLGDTTDALLEGVGYAGTLVATGGLGASAGLGTLGTTALTSGLTLTSGFGSGTSQAYQSGATDEEAHLFGLISGASESMSELLFGGLGKFASATGISKGIGGIDDILIKKATSKINNVLAKNLAQGTLKATGEGLEEVIAGTLQAAGKKATYMSEKEFEEILKDENLLEQFVIGSLTSGVMQANGVYDSTKAGRDLITGYTQNEQSVIDKEIENRVTEAEKDGKTLSNREINEITKEVQDDFNKGYVSTDTIESVLGGDTYSYLQTLRDRKTSLENEINELENKKANEITVKENERLKAIREELSGIDTNTLETQLQSEMEQKIKSDGYLQNTYAEKSKRGQQFAYDSTKITNEFEKATYESATKFMNDTTRSHEFVEKVAKISKDKGTNYEFINNEELKKLGHNVEGKQVNGLVKVSKDGKQTILINVDSNKALNTIVGHETTHLLEGTQEYQELQDAIFNYAKTKGDFDSRQANLTELYQGIENANIDSELTADLVGDYLFTDADFISELSVQKPTVFQKIRELIDDLVVRFKGTKEEKALREVQKKFKEAYRQSGTQSDTQTDTQYSLFKKKNTERELNVSPEFAEEIVERTRKNIANNENASMVDINKVAHLLGNGGYRTQEQISSLESSIMANGLQQPIELTNSDGELKIENGNHRLAAAIKMGLKEVPVTNAELLADSNVKYSLSEKGTLQDSNGNDVTLKANNTGTTGNLLAIHGLSATNLKSVLSLGGFPVPSIGITQSNNASVIEEFGGSEGITVVFDKSTIDPKTKTNEVYSNDVYSKTIPTTYQKVDKKALQKVIDEFHTYESEYGSLNKHDYSKSSLESIVDDLSYSTPVKAKFLEDSGYGIKKVYKDFRSNYYSFTAEEIENFKKKYPDLASLDEYSVDTTIAPQIKEITLDMMAEGTPEVSREEYAKLFDREFYLNDVIKFYRDIKQYDRANTGQEFDSYATRDNINKAVKEHQEEFNQWLTGKFENLYGDKYFENEKGRKYDYTLENLTSYMKKGSTKTQQKGMFDTFGVGQAKASASRKFKSLDQIRVESQNLLDTETYKERTKAFEEIDDDVRTEIGSERISNGEGVFEVYSDYYMALAEAITKNVTSEEALNHNWFKNITKEQIDKFDIVKEQLKKFPAKYFEAKPQRTVGLNEIKALVVPNTLESTFKQQLIDNGYNVIEYDPNVEGDRTSKINELDYLKFSLSNQNEIAPRNPNLTYGEDVKLQQQVEETIAPLQEEIQTLTETVNELKEQLAPVQEQVTEQVKEIEYTQPSKAELDNLMTLQETGGTEYANEFFRLRDKYGQPKLYKGINEYKKAPDTYEATIKGDEFAPTPQNIVEQQGQEAFNNIDESIIPPEIEEFAPTDEVTPTKSLFETRNYEEVGSRKVNAYQYDNPEVKPYFQEAARSMIDDLATSQKGQRIYNDELYYSSGGEQGYFGIDRFTTNDIAELLDGVDGKYKLSYKDIEKGLKAIIEDEGAENNAASKRIEFYLDKRLREGFTTLDGIEVPANQEYLELLEAKDITDYYNGIPIGEAPIDNVSNSKPVENIAPIKEQYEAITPRKSSEPKLIKVKEPQKLERSEGRVTKASEPEMINKGYQLTMDGKAEKVIDNTTYNQIAKIVTTEPKTESDRNKRKWAIFRANIFDKATPFEDLALKENNRELMGKWDYTLTSEARGQYAIGNGHNGLSKSLNDIREAVDNTGNTKEFYEYMYHKHNVDRMTLDKRFGIENKAVFGDSVTAEQSQAIVNEYEKSHPEFLEFAKDVYDYVNADKQLLVDNGVISQETSDLWSKMYPHYVPTRRTVDTGLDINVPLDTRRTGINAPVKKATGGSADILPLFDTMAMRTLQTYKAIAKNNFGVELKNTLGTTVENNQTNVDEVIESLEAQEELLQEGKQGSNPTFTVFENGEKVTFEITKDMYDALKPVSESSLLSKTIKPLNVAGNIRRGLLTEYNPTFMLTNTIKDVQDVLMNSQHAVRTYSKIPEAYAQLSKKGYWYQEYVRNGGERNSYFDSETNTFSTQNKGLSKILDLPPFSTISKINNFIEMAPRLAEYIASREAGRSVEVSMLDAARVTTNFKAGGSVTKFANRNGATFLNASVQGAMQNIRNIREAKANGLKGWVNLATKSIIAGLPAILLNNLVWDDDEEYEELSDYVKQNYYVVAKDDNGNFIRIPKGRTVAVIQEGINQMGNLITGDDEADLKSFIDLTINNLAPNNPIENNLFSPIVQVANNEAWYGGDLVPTRLQNMPKAEQYDESTDMFSRWVGETFNVSPYKVNYLLDQYSGGLGDLILPMMTPEAESDGEGVKDYLLAPIKDKFTTNATLNNQNVTDFYDLKEKLTTNANMTNATDEDILKNKYISSISGEIGELYNEKREIQNSDLSNSEKYSQAMAIQEQINEMTKNALSEYKNVSITSSYAQVGDREYYKYTNKDGEEGWAKINEEEAEDIDNLGLTRSEKSSYFNAKKEISSINTDDNDYQERKNQIIEIIKDTGFSDEQKAYLYKKYYNTDTVDTIVNSGINIDAYFDYSSKEFVADKDSSGKSISGTRKDKVIKYINAMNLSVPEKAILIKATNTFKFNDYNNDIVKYVDGLNISDEEKVSILEELDMKVDSQGNVTWE